VVFAQFCNANPVNCWNTYLKKKALSQLCTRGEQKYLPNPGEEKTSLSDRANHHLSPKSVSKWHEAVEKYVENREFVNVNQILTEAAIPNWKEVTSRIGFHLLKILNLELL